LKAFSIFCFILLLSLPCFAKEETILIPTVEGTDFSSFTDEFDKEFDDTTDSSEMLESYNRAMTTFNDNLYVHILRPISNEYSHIVPRFVGVGISNAFNNIAFPSRFINNILQFKIANSFEELGRFTINSTIGIFGLIDVARMLNLESHDEDFGQTLGYYGVGSGFYIVLPILGPSNIRDAFGSMVDVGFGVLSLSPISSDFNIDFKGIAIASSIKSFELINELSLNLEMYESLKKDSIDLHSSLKNMYKQSREAKIKE